MPLPKRWPLLPCCGRCPGTLAAPPRCGWPVRCVGATCCAGLAVGETGEVRWVAPACPGLLAGWTGALVWAVRGGCAAALRWVGAVAGALLVVCCTGVSRRSTVFSDVPAVGAAPVLPLVAEARAGVVVASAALVGAVVRLRVAGFAVWSWLSGAGAALSVFARVVERLRVVAGFACTSASGDSDVLFIRKAPFYE